MTVGFQDQFCPRVEDGSKTHTIRGGSRFRVGMRVDLFKKHRRPKKYNAAGEQIDGMRLMFRAIVTKVEEIRICHGGLVGKLEVSIEGVNLSRDEKLAFFWRDGFRPEPGDPFDSQNMAAAFWREQLDDGPFEGQVIHWDYENRFMAKPKPSRSVTRKRGARNGKALQRQS